MKTHEEKLRKVVTDQLSKYIQKENKYNGIIRIIAEPDFLISCSNSGVNQIISTTQEGNQEMSTSLNNKTIDGISRNW